MGSASLALEQLPSLLSAYSKRIASMAWSRDHIIQLEQLYGKQRRASSKSDLLTAGCGSQDRRVISCTNSRQQSGSQRHRNNLSLAGQQLFYQHLQASLCN